MRVALRRRDARGVMVRVVQAAGLAK
jgi:hypothetical protein